MWFKEKRLLYFLLTSEDPSVQALAIIFIKINLKVKVMCFRIDLSLTNASGYLSSRLEC